MVTIVLLLLMFFFFQNLFGINKEQRLFSSPSPNKSIKILSLSFKISSRFLTLSLVSLWCLYYNCRCLFFFFLRQVFGIDDRRLFRSSAIKNCWVSLWAIILFWLSADLSYLSSMHLLFTSLFTSLFTFSLTLIPLFSLLLLSCPVSPSSHHFITYSHCRHFEAKYLHLFVCPSCNKRPKSHQPH